MRSAIPGVPAIVNGVLPDMVVTLSDRPDEEGGWSKVEVVSVAFLERAA